MFRAVGPSPLRLFGGDRTLGLPAGRVPAQRCRIFLVPSGLHLHASFLEFVPTYLEVILQTHYQH